MPRYAMPRYALAALIALFLPTILLAADAPANAAPGARPNMLLVFLDDMRYDAMSCAGHAFAKTPNMDRLAREGVYCNNSFVVISLCAPSRACYQTGQYAHTHGVIRNNGTDLRRDAVTGPKVLQKAGYQTGYFGKWHQAPTDEPRPGYDVWVSYKGQGVYTDPVLNIKGQSRKVKGYIDDLVTDEAVNWLTKERDPARPFSITLAFKSVHAPFLPPERDKDLYTDAKFDWPPTHDQPLSDLPAFVRSWLEMEKPKHMEFDYDTFIRRYNRTIRGADDNLGRVLAALEKVGQLDNTMIVFSSDNGYYQGEHHGLFDKRSAYEESIRVPMLVRYPRLAKAGTKLDGMVLNIDVQPTFLELAGVKPPETMQGRSILPLLAGNTKDWRTSFLYEYFREKSYPNTPTIQGVRTDRFKYIRYLNPEDRPELYDLKADPLERHNLHDDPAAAATLTDMKKELARLVRETGASTQPE
jgi:arylsulfatase A-like enzyme